MKKIYLLFLLCCLGFAVSAQHLYQPTSTSTFTGAASYCQGTTANPLVFTYNTCNSGIGVPTGASCTITWYYNTTNTTVISGGTITVSTPPPFACPTTVTAIQSYTPSTAVSGNFYYFCVISWTGGTAGCPGGVTNSITSAGTQLVSINAPLPPITPGVALTPDSVCVGSTLALSNTLGGGAWTSSTPGTASVNSTGLVTGISPGVTIISYAFGGCYVTRFVNVNDTPSSITPGASPAVCVGLTVTLSDASAGGTWLSSVPGTASVGSTGIVTGIAAGAVTITYKFSASGCYVTRQVNVIPNPAPITGSTGICVSGNSTLSDGTIPGTWSTSSTSATVGATTGNVVGVFPGTATITYMIPSGCYSTIVVTISASPALITGSTFSVCAGGSIITLTDVTPGGSWSSAFPGTASVGSSSGIVTGVTAGTVNITYTTPGCTAVSHTVTVNALPGPITGVFSACNGLTSNLFNTTPSGQWFSSDTLVARVDTFSGTVTGLTMGTTTITYKIGTGCNVTAVVTVNPLAPILGTDTICVASTALLTDIVGGGTWASSNPAVATIGASSGLVTGIVTGITFVVYTLPTACSTSFFLRVLPPVPTIAGQHEICSGSVTTLSDAFPGGTWSTDNAFVANINSTTGMMSGLFPDSVHIRYTVYGCVTTVTVTVDPLPTPVITHDWTTHTLTTGNFYVSYQWYDSSAGALNATVIPGATNNTLVIPRVDNYFKVTVTDTKGCVNTTDWYFRNYTGVNNLTDESIHIYPNPATSKVFIESSTALKAVITGMEGKVLLEQQDAKELNISKLPPGIYLMALSDENGQIIKIQKLIKE